MLTFKIFFILNGISISYISKKQAVVELSLNKTIKITQYLAAEQVI